MVLEHGLTMKAYKEVSEMDFHICGAIYYFVKRNTLLSFGRQLTTTVLSTSFGKTFFIRRFIPN